MATSDKAPGGQAPLTVAAVARRLGVAPSTLRTWDRRYGLGPTAHEPGAHRRYSPQDVARLGIMRRLTRKGVPAAESARIAQATPASELTLRPDRLEARVAVVARPRDTVRALVRSAQALDAESVSGQVAESLERRGAVATWDSLCVPSLRALGDRWAHSGAGVDVEHLASECMLGAFHQYAHRMSLPRAGARSVLLACAEEEQHSLPLFAVAAALGERDIGSRVLGARVPSDALVAAVRRLAPAAVLVWSQQAETGDLAQMDRLARLNGRVGLLAIGGPGWRRDALLGHADGRLIALDDLAEAVVALTGAVG